MIKKTKIRWVLLFMIFLMCMIAYFDRINMAVCGPMIMVEYGLTKVQLGMAMSAFFFAYVLMQIPGGFLSEKYGVRLVGALAVTAWSIFTILTPFAWGFISLLVIRFLFGLAEGPLYPNNGVFVAHWQNKNEKAIASGSALSGNWVGCIIATPLAVWILSQWNWHTVFYLYGLFGIVIAITWYLLSRDFPHLHPWTNREEIEYITGETLEHVKETTKHEVAPWRKFLKNGRFWALGAQIFSVSYMMYLFLTWLPIYLLEARGLNLKAMGFAVSYPWIAILLTTFFGGRLSDMLVSKGYSKFKARTIPAIIGLIVSGISFYMAGNAITPNESIVWLIISLGFLGFTYISGYTSCQDLGKKFGGSVESFMQVWSNSGGILAPIITPILVLYFGWQQAFLMTSFIVVPGIILWFFVKPDKALIEV